MATRAGNFPANNRSFHQPHHHWRRDFPPPFSAARRRPNFVIEFRCQTSNQNSYNRHEIVTLLGELKFRPDDFSISEAGVVAARFCYHRWPDVLHTVVYLWRIRLNGGLSFIPRLVRNLTVPSDLEEYNSKVRLVFVERIRGFLEGDLMKKWESRYEDVSKEVAGIDARLKKPNKFQVHMELVKEKERNMSEKDMIGRRIREFRSAMACILDYLDGKVYDDSDDFRVFRLTGDFDWSKICWLITRECRRLDDGLPIYADRTDILRQIQWEQVMILVGETGSGKSTQLVQYLSDSALAAHKCIVCTQPRKLAAMSLTKRVQEETHGCLEDNSVVCAQTYSSSEQFDSKVIYMTDHCLLQHYMNDTNFSKISCIVVDEVHERSLNTDLLLALTRDVLQRRLDLRLIVMSATADAEKLAEYFFRCGTHHVVGRNFPVDIRYVPGAPDAPYDTGLVAPYVSDVVRMVREIHRTEEEGAILAFLTSQMEVEWACEKFQEPSAVALPLHGKLSHEEQYRVYLSQPVKRKVIFSTNLAETSLTIPGVKYVVDSGMVKESRFESGTGMNILKVCRISQSSANQRAGRAGRTEPGKCYRLYGENDFRSMPTHQEPEIRRVHLGIAVLRILALGVKNIDNFNFIDAPSRSAIQMAIRNLIQLGAITVENGAHRPTRCGRSLVKLGIEPRLGKIILNCYEQILGREGLVLAAVMANSSSIFCRVGTQEDKHKSDRLKVQFCHRNGDLFTLLAVYRKWESIGKAERNQWCWDNSINAKTMRRCQEMVQEMEHCLQNELHILIPSYWRWTPETVTEHDKVLKHIILSSLAENVAMYTGHDHLGYEVALSGSHVQLHPSSSLLMFGERPRWVVFGEILSIPNQYLVCVTAVDFKSFETLSPPPLFDVLQMESQKLEQKVLTGFGNTLLRRFCGKFNSGLKHLISLLKDATKDDRTGVDVLVDQNEVHLFASSQNMEEVSRIVHDALECERKLLENECIEKCLYPGRRAPPPFALFGAGAEIQHLELEKKCLTVDIYLSGPNDVDEKELLQFLESKTSGRICSVHRFGGDNTEKWGKVTFLTPTAAEKATKMSGIEFNDASLRVSPSRIAYGGDSSKPLSFPSIKAKVSWPRRRSRGFAFIKCETPEDVSAMVEDFRNLEIAGRNVVPTESTHSTDNILLMGIDKEVCEAELLDVLSRSTNRKIVDLHLVRGEAVEHRPLIAYEEALVREIHPFMPNPTTECVRVQVFPAEPKNYFMKAEISFDGSLHLEAARALEHIQGKALAGCQPWQKIKCQQQFHSCVSCPAPAYAAIKDPLHSLLNNLQRRKGVECVLDRNENGTYRVKISAKATKIMAESRRPLEQLMNGRTIVDERLTAPVLNLLFSRDGFVLQKSIQRDTGTYFLFDRHRSSFRVFGPLTKLDMAQRRLVQSLLSLYENKQLDVRLRGPGLPPDLMKTMVDKFGPNLNGLRETLPQSEFILNTRNHLISVNRGGQESKQKLEEIIHEIAQTCSGTPSAESHVGPVCPICLCDVEDGYRLARCDHELCRACLVDQCESAIKNHDTFPVRCAREACGAAIVVSDLRSLLSADRLDELFRASLGAFVLSSGGKYRFCPSPDCPSVYAAAADAAEYGQLAFTCGSCSVETCTRCHLEYHPLVTCEEYRKFKEDPDSSLKEWSKGKRDVKRCPVCGFTIEKIDGCNHVECRCGKHICWVCLGGFFSSDECYDHMRAVHPVEEFMDF